jgi:hypothetical protein
MCDATPRSCGRISEMCEATSYEMSPFQSSVVSPKCEMPFQLSRPRNVEAIPEYLRKCDAIPELWSRITKCVIPLESISVDARKVGMPLESISVDTRKVGIPLESISVDTRKVGMPLESISIDTRKVGIPLESISIDTRKVGILGIDFCRYTEMRDAAPELSGRHFEVRLFPRKSKGWIPNYGL